MLVMHRKIKERKYSVITFKQFSNGIVRIIVIKKVFIQDLIGLHKKWLVTIIFYIALKNAKPIPELERKVSNKKPTVKVGNPTSLDWRDKDGQNYVTSVKDQGSCGSCWTFAGAAASESYLIIAGTQDIDIDFSEQYLLECTSESDCNGGYMENVMEEITTQGLPLE